MFGAKCSKLLDIGCDRLKLGKQACTMLISIPVRSLLFYDRKRRLELLRVSEAGRKKVVKIGHWSLSGRRSPNLVAKLKTNLPNLGEVPLAQNPLLKMKNYSLRVDGVLAINDCILQCIATGPDDVGRRKSFRVACQLFVVNRWRGKQSEAMSQEQFGLILIRQLIPDDVVEPPEQCFIQ